MKRIAVISVETLANDPKHIWCDICRISCHTTLLQLAETTTDPAATFAPKFDMYVADLLTGASSQMEAKALQDVLIKHLFTADPLNQILLQQYQNLRQHLK